MIWLLYEIIQLPLMLFCYLTNPIVCLFADEKGDLPKIFKLWQTWDDCCDVRFYVLEEVPKFLRYDYDRHYEEITIHTDELSKMGCFRYGVRIKDPHFTLKERLQRYLCRVGWLTRNCGYGIAFWLFGKTVDRDSVKEKVYPQDSEHSLTIGWDKSKNIWTRPWWVKSNRVFWKIFEWNIYLGWKWWPDSNRFRRTMIANRLCFRLKKG